MARLGGEIDVANAIELEAELTWAIPNTALGLIVDLSEVSFIDSTGIRCLFDLAMRLERGADPPLRQRRLTPERVLRQVVTFVHR